MAISDKDRKDHKEGRRDSRKGVFEQALNDIAGTHPGTEAYYKGRRNEQLDKDKKKDRK